MANKKFVRCVECRKIWTGQNQGSVSRVYADSGRVPTQRSVCVGKDVQLKQWL